MTVTPSPETVAEGSQLSSPRTSPSLGLCQALARYRVAPAPQRRARSWLARGWTGNPDCNCNRRLGRQRAGKHHGRPSRHLATQPQHCRRPAADFYRECSGYLERDGRKLQSTCASATSCVFTAGSSTGPANITATETSPAGLQAQTTANITAAATPGSTPVLTFHNDQLRSGANITEFVLNTGNVNQSQFGLKYTYSVDGQIYAQPLYVPNLTVNGGQHNVVFVATQNDTVYAFDADGLSTSALWSTSLGTPRKVSGSSTGTPIYPSVGVTSTPVIDSSTNTMYVLAATSTGYEINALDILTGKVTGSEKVTASVERHRDRQFERDYLVAQGLLSATWTCAG